MVKKKTFQAALHNMRKPANLVCRHFFSQALLSPKTQKMPGELTTEKMLSAWVSVEVNDTFCQALFLKI